MGTHLWVGKDLDLKHWACEYPRCINFLSRMAWERGSIRLQGHQGGKPTFFSTGIRFLRVRSWGTTVRTILLVLPIFLQIYQSKFWEDYLFRLSFLPMEMTKSTLQMGQKREKGKKKDFEVLDKSIDCGVRQALNQILAMPLTNWLPWRFA